MKTLFLTFDDGPLPGHTDRVLDILGAHGARATFFVVVARAERHPELVRRTLDEGHAVGNHSLDHRYANFFRGTAGIGNWIDAAETRLRALIGDRSVGFRSPAGVRTPPLGKALRARRLPNILWDVRFYDAIWRVDEGRLYRRLAAARDGSVVLLHDVQRAKNQGRFLSALEGSVARLAREGCAFAPLARVYPQDS